MGSGTSGLYAGTRGSKHISSGLFKILMLNVYNWASEESERLGEISKRKQDSFNTACIVYDESSGNYYYGMNKGIFLEDDPKNPILFGENGILPKNNQEHYAIGNCAEVHAINKALNNGADLSDLTILTIKVDQRSSRTGELKPACRNCTYAFKGKIKNNYSGWKGI